MDIKQAIERVAALSKDIESLDRALDKAAGTEYGKPRRIETRVWVSDHGTETVILNRDSAIDLLHKTKAALESERAALQPIIDMANAALKGIGA